jgi:hypothetical protein
LIGFRAHTSLNTHTHTYLTRNKDSLDRKRGKNDPFTEKRKKLVWGVDLLEGKYLCPHMAA